MCQHVSLEPALTGGRGVVHLTALPQTHKHLEEECEKVRKRERDGMIKRVEREETEQRDRDRKEREKELDMVAR